MDFFTDIKLDRGSPEPLFLQLTRQLGAIISGQIPDSPYKMPSVRKLAAALSVDRSTVSRAYLELKKSGLLVQHSPRIIHSPADRIKRNIEPLPAIGVILPEKISEIAPGEFPFIMEYLKGILDAATENNVSISMLQLPDANSRSTENTGKIQEIKRHFTGIIHMGHRLLDLDSPLHKLMCCKDLPQVLIAAKNDYPNILQIIPDDLSGAEELAAICRKFDLHKIGIALPFPKLSASDSPNPYCAYTCVHRGEVFREFFSRNGFVCDDAFDLFDQTGSAEVLKSLKQKKNKGLLPDLYFCYDDEIAMWMLDACRELQIAVPQRLSIVGFNGIKTPQTEDLSTIRLPFYTIGAKAVENIVKQFADGNPILKERLITIPTEFINGKTTGKKQP